MLGKVLKDIFFPKGTNLSEKHAASDAKLETAVQRDGGQIIWFAAASEGNALLNLTQEYLRPFEKLASRIVGFDVNKHEWMRELKAALEEPVWFVFSYFGVGQEITIQHGGKYVNLWEASGIPFVRLFGDIPAYFPDRHVGNFRNSINAYQDRTHAAFYRRWFPDPALSTLLPPIIIDQLPLERVDVERKLQGKIVFPKNGNSPGQLIDYWRLSLPSTVVRILLAVAEESVALEWINREPRLDDRLISQFAEIGVDISTDRAVLCFLVAQLDDYVRRVKSTMIAEALLDLPIILRGRFWEHLNFRGRRAIHDPDSDMASTQALIDQAPALVDMSPNIQHIPHDRVLRAAGRGTAFLTNTHETLNRLLPTHRFTFDFERDTIRSLVEHYVTHPREAVDLGLEQARVLRSAFKEDDYIDAMLGAVQVCALRIGSRPIGTQNFVNFPPRVFR